MVDARRWAPAMVEAVEVLRPGTFIGLDDPRVVVDPLDADSRLIVEAKRAGVTFTEISRAMQMPRETVRRRYYSATGEIAPARPWRRKRRRSEAQVAADLLRGVSRRWEEVGPPVSEDVGVQIARRIFPEMTEAEALEFARRMEALRQAAAGASD